MEKIKRSLLNVSKNCSEQNFNSHKVFYGFTIVELLVVIVVIGILAAITIVSYTGISQKATVTSLITDLDNASKQLKMDQVVKSNFPTTLAAANSGKGITASPGNTYTDFQFRNANPQAFCLTAENTNGTSYRITNDSSPSVGTCTVLTNGLILYLDAGKTTSYSGTGTTWTDLSGNGYIGNLINGVGYTSADGGALSFDGVDDYVSNINFGGMVTTQITQS
jgi:prepilin-type N-terminal cleavage/methylation domain-containing protein